MDPIIYLAVLLLAFGIASYGVTLMPLEPKPKQFAHLGLVLVLLAVIVRHFGLV